MPDKADCIDGTELHIQIDVWSRKIGGVEAKQGANAVKVALDDVSLAPDGFTVVIFEHERTDHLRDPDGETHHSVVTFHALAEAQ